MNFFPPTKTHATSICQPISSVYFKQQKNEENTKKEEKSRRKLKASPSLKNILKNIQKKNIKNQF